MDTNSQLRIPTQYGPAPGAFEVPLGFELPRGFNQNAPARRAALVTAIVVTKRRSPFVAATLRAVQGQTRPPDRVIVVDADAPKGAYPQLGLQLNGAGYVAGGKADNFGAAVNLGLRAIGPASAVAGQWLWLLHDDGAPAPDALAHLLNAVEHSSAIGIAGCKQRRWEVTPKGEPSALGNPATQLVSVGHTVSKRGVRVTGIEPGEIDQGQHDGREDVLAVSLAGALVKADVWAHLEGTEPLYGSFGDSTDFCRRAWRVGARVVVVPNAVVYHAQAGLLGLRQMTHLRHKAPGAAQQIALSRGLAKAVATPESMAQTLKTRRLSEVGGTLARRVWLGRGLVWSWLLLKAPFAAAAQLMAKQPAAALVELLLPLRLLGQTVAIHRAHQRLNRTTSLPQRVTSPLTATWRQVHQAKLDAQLSTSGGAENNIGSESTLSQRLRAASDLTSSRRDGAGAPAHQFSHLAAVLLVLLGVTGYLTGPWVGKLLAGYRITGPALLPASAPLAETWARATAGGIATGGLASGGFRAGAVAAGQPAADPFLLIFAALATLMRSGQAAVNLLILGAIPLAGLTAWVAAGVLLRKPQIRALVALAWGLSPVLLAALANGYLGLIMAHLVLPLVVAASARALCQRKLGALAAAGLLTAVLVASYPALLGLVLGFALVVALVAKKRRWYGAAVLLPALVLGAPFWVVTLPPVLLPDAATTAATAAAASPGIIATLSSANATAQSDITAPQSRTWAGYWRQLIAPPLSPAAPQQLKLSDWVTPAGPSLTQISPTPAPVPAAAQLLQSNSAGALLYLSGTPSSVAYSLLRHNGSALTEASVLSGAQVEASDLPGLVADLIAGTSADTATRLAQQGVVGVIVPPNNANLTQQLDQNATLIRVTEGIDSPTLWRLDQPSPLPASALAGTTNRTDLGSLLGHPLGQGRVVWLAALIGVFASYLLVAVPSPRTLVNSWIYPIGGALRLGGPLTVGVAGLAVVGASAFVYFAPTWAAAFPGDPAPQLPVTALATFPTTTTAAKLVCPQPVLPSSTTDIAPGLAGTIANWADEGEERGLAIAPCPLPESDLWLVGGASGPGQIAQLQITNPGTRPASVSLEVYGLTGQLTLGSRSLFPVAPGETVMLPLDAIAPDQPRLTVHATAQGSVITAAIATTRLDGLNAGGIELVSPAAPPSNQIIVAGLRSDGQSPADPSAPVVRLLAPTADTTATLTIIGANGNVQLPGLEPTGLKAGVPADVSLGGLAPGEYAIAVTASQPIVGAGRWVRATGDLHDDAWIASSSFAETSHAMLPGNTKGTIVIAAPEGITQPITGSVSGRVDTEFTVLPGHIALVEVPYAAEASLVTVEASTPVAWGLVVTAAHDPGLVAGLTPTPASEAESGSIIVRPTLVR